MTSFWKKIFAKKLLLKNGLQFLISPTSHKEFFHSLQKEKDRKKVIKRLKTKSIFLEKERMIFFQEGVSYAFNLSKLKKKIMSSFFELSFSCLHVLFICQKIGRRDYHKIINMTQKIFFWKSTSVILKNYSQKEISF